MKANLNIEQVTTEDIVRQWSAISRDEQDAAMIWFDNTDTLEVEIFCDKRGIMLRDGKGLMRGWQLLAMTTWVQANRYYAR